MSDKPKEFWIVTPDGLSPTAHTIVYQEDPKLAEVYDRKIYHVVEHSAYEDLKHNFEAVKKTCDNYWKAFTECYDALNEAQCNCTLQERDSGHKTDCWMPEVIEIIQRHQ